VLVVRGQWHDAAGIRRGADLRARHAGEHPGRARDAGQRAGEHGDVKPAEPYRRQLRVVLEVRRHLAVRIGQGQPELDPVQPRVVVLRRFLGVGDAAPRGHQVELAGPDELLAAQAVPVQHGARDEPGHRLQPDMRVRRDLHAGHPVDRRRAVVVDEAPCAHAAPLPQRQEAAHVKVADPGEARRGDLGARHPRVPRGHGGARNVQV
jgi:hypothetical protein